MSRTAESARAATLLLSALLHTGCGSRVPGAQLRPAAELRVLQDIEYLTSNALAGRQAGTEGADSAAVFIAQRFFGLQLPPAFTACDPTGECRKRHYQYFRFQTFPGAGEITANVAAIVVGSDSALRNQVLAIGAHYDHLGRSNTYALDRDVSGIRRGADDNASGTAGLLELARRFSERPARRSVLFVAFGAEEVGLIGTGVFIDKPPLPLDSVTAMLNLDMIGWLRGRSLTVHGATGQGAIVMLLDSANAFAGFSLLKRRGSGRSDDASFSQKGIPTLHFYTGDHNAYHTIQDRVGLLNVSGLVRVVDLVEAVARRIADRPELLPRVRQ